MDHNTPAPQAFAELLVEHNLDMRQVLGHLAAMATPQAVNQAPIKTEAPPPHRIHLDEIDILVDVVQVLDKCNTNYMDVHRFCKQHYFNQDLNLRKCTMHQADSYVAEATYMYIVTSWEQATPPVEAKTIYMPVIKTFNATLAAAQHNLYNQNINTTNYRHHHFKGRQMSKEKGPIAKHTQSSHAHHKAESDKEEEEEEEEGDNNNSNGKEDDNTEEEEEEDQKSSKTPKKKTKWTWQEAQDNPTLATAIMAWQLEHHQTLHHQAVSGLQAKNEKLTAEVVELKQKLDTKEQHHHHHKKHKHPNTPAAAAYKDPLMQEPSEKKAKADKTEDKILAKACSSCTTWSQSTQPSHVTMFKCITCALHVPPHNIEVCTWCIRHLWTNADHSGHIWQVVYQPTDAGVVAESLRPWLQA
ncbi:uncharacterized protein ACA1_362450 [Acanthamoeba castellanii str. Neff]|uniref:Uncharacterized protein n=1 Tax=Acanthamoeba castellanii (strain ATCC 30010 / Neff) TaxID=1257118 RepID=L8GHU3_ACACF|nr:uncharacterized protein ACA1_362450 [Acanthamoeba castellanii str. Neff]ELR11761.1 hypothetical protein ACA1_362450 [Acanthamoeba castellanii str. Neff]